jgi:hypothetical protein
MNEIPFNEIRITCRMEKYQNIDWINCLWYHNDQFLNASCFLTKIFVDHFSVISHLSSLFSHVSCSLSIATFRPRSCCLTNIVPEIIATETCIIDPIVQQRADQGREISARLRP